MPPKGKQQQKGKKKHGPGGQRDRKRPRKSAGGKSKRNRDKRFAAATEDPRFGSAPQKKKFGARDSRFQDMFTNPDFHSQYKVDRYGRNIGGTNLLEEDTKQSMASGSGTSEKPHTMKRWKRKMAAAKMSGVDANNGDSNEEEIDPLAFFDTKPKGHKGDSGGDDESESGGDSALDRAEGEMFDYNESSTDSSEGSRSDGNYSDLAPYDIGEDMRAVLDTGDVPDVEATKRLAVLNLDWDNLRAVDIYMVLRSFVSDGLVGVSIHPSDFGKEQMEKEKRMGPDRSCWAHAATTSTRPKPEEEEEDEGAEDKTKKHFGDGAKNEDEDKNEKAEVAKSGEDAEGKEEEEEELEGLTDAMKEELSRLEDLQQSIAAIRQSRPGAVLEDANKAVVDKNALRKYELQRLRYFYAVVECDSARTGDILYQGCDGREFELTGNVMDLRFIEESFEAPNAATDECFEAPESYTPASSHTVNNSMASTFVSLTWDRSDPNRVEAARRSFKEDEVLKMDLKAYLESDGEITDAGFETDYPVTEYDTDTPDKKVKVKRRARARYKGILDDLNATMKALVHSSSDSSADGGSDAGGNDAFANFMDSATKTDYSKDSSKPGTVTVVGSSAVSSSAKVADDSGDKDEEEEEDDGDKDAAEDSDSGQICVISDLSAEERELADGSIFADALSDNEELVVGGSDIPRELMQDPYFAEELSKGKAEKSGVAKSSGESVAKRRKLNELATGKLTSEESKRMDEYSSEQRMKAHLELLMLGDGYDPEDNEFDMSTLSERFQKRMNRDWKLKRLIKKKINEKLKERDSFSFNHDDDRFASVYSDPQYAIDPSNPGFKASDIIDSVMHKARESRTLTRPNTSSTKSASRKRKTVPRNEYMGIAAKLKQKAAEFSD